MEVIRDSQDYAGVTLPADFEVPHVNFKIAQHKPVGETKPALYILLDKGYLVKNEPNTEEVNLQTEF